MSQAEWDIIVQQNTYAMSYYVVKVGPMYLTHGGMQTSYPTLARTFLTDSAASNWARANAAGLNWTVESLTA